MKAARVARGPNTAPNPSSIPVDTFTDSTEATLDLLKPNEVNARDIDADGLIAQAWRRVGCARVRLDPEGRGYWITLDGLDFVRGGLDVLVGPRGKVLDCEFCECDPKRYVAKPSYAQVVEHVAPIMSDLLVCAGLASEAAGWAKQAEEPATPPAPAEQQRDLQLELAERAELDGDEGVAGRYRRDAELAEEENVFPAPPAEPWRVPGLVFAPEADVSARLARHDAGEATPADWLTQAAIHRAHVAPLAGLADRFRLGMHTAADVAYVIARAVSEGRSHELCAEDCERRAADLRRSEAA